MSTDDPLLAGAGDPVPGHVPDFYRDLVREFIKERAFAGNIADGYARDLAFARLQTLDRDLGHARDLARARALGLCGARQVVLSAAGLLAAVRLLPPADRARYAEEYRSELWDLAQSGAGWLRQLGYAMRQLLRILPMCCVLRSPRHRSPAP